MLFEYKLKLVPGGRNFIFFFLVTVGQVVKDSAGNAAYGIYIINSRS